jgi:hypothetical protein
METPEQEALQYRKKKTVWLTALGAASLLIPLAGAFYVDWRQNAGASGPSGRNDVFERREGEDRKMIPTQSALIIASPGPSAGGSEQPAASSLSFIKGGEDMNSGAPAATAAPAPAPASTETVVPATVPPAQAAAPQTGKPTKKPFTPLKLQPSPFGGLGSILGSDKSNGATKTGGRNAKKSLTTDSNNNPAQGLMKNSVGP